MFGALIRLLREEGTKNIELAINVVYIFFCFSHFSQFHQFLSSNKVGDSCLRIVESELDRCKKLQDDIDQSKGNAKKLELAQKKLAKIRPYQEQLLAVCFHVLLNLAEDVTIEKKMKNRNIVFGLVEVLDWSNQELLIVSLTFLKKMSIFKENKNDMVL